MARLLDAGQRRFRIVALPGGEYLLTPVVSASQRELALLRNPEAVMSLKAGIGQAANDDVVRYEAGHFSRRAEGIDAGED